MGTRMANASEATSTGRMQGLPCEWKLGQRGSGKAPLWVPGERVPCASFGLQSPGELPLARGETPGFGAALCIQGGLEETSLCGRRIIKVR